MSKWANEIPHLLVHEQADNVGVVVVEGLTAGTDMLCCVTHDNSTFRLTAKADVPIGHKIALKDLKAGRHRDQVRRGHRQDRRRHPKGGTSTPTIARPSAGKEPVMAQWHRNIPT
jgi:hypothetical protein